MDTVAPPLPLPQVFLVSRVGFFLAFSKIQLHSCFGGSLLQVRVRYIFAPIPAGFHSESDGIRDVEKGVARGGGEGRRRGSPPSTPPSIRVS